ETAAEWVRGAGFPAIVREEEAEFTSADGGVTDPSQDKKPQKNRPKMVRPGPSFRKEVQGDKFTPCPSYSSQTATRRTSTPLPSDCVEKGTPWIPARALQTYPVTFSKVSTTCSSLISICRN